MQPRVVILFPEKKYFGTQADAIPVFTACVQQRYLARGYALTVVNYRGSHGCLTTLPAQEVCADVTFEAATADAAGNFTPPNFTQIAKDLQVETCGRVVVGGFHCFDCVAKLADALYQINPRVTVDTDLTEMFFTRQYDADFQLSQFNPDAKLKSFVADGSAAFLAPRVKARYQHPMWQISPQMLRQLDAGAVVTHE